ncbi:transglycosylase SLT domain-containing protein [Zunongwangia sp. HGR-M22]|uniref:transglycosylase SLT domain-containing protein n=1 Tax=Zunongwangia sp. HGR-M22 TaxID=3015168 RepID=UPI0022DE5EFA|nr:transporter substrate-binding domain-containing protein [Zunongwangia sp. HGR-M22]WBL24442.1 transporter substrate-binding domain-containing protein [Zunongwangia sp. HGR-M22]
MIRPLRHFFTHSNIFKFSICIFLLGTLLNCSESRNTNAEDSPELAINQYSKSFSEIKEDGKLTVITIYNSTSYFLYRGKPMGFEYELVKKLAEHLNLELDIKVAEDIDHLFDMLNAGEGDLIAFGLSVTEDRKKLVNFTDYHYLTHQVLVQRRPEDWRRLPMYKIKKQTINDPIEMIGKTVHVRKNSSYFERLENLEDEIGGQIDIQLVPGNKTTEDIIKMVVNEEIDYTIADYNIAAINQTYNPILDIDTEISFSQRIAWAVRKNSSELLAEINAWLKNIKKKDFYYVVYNKYFKNKKSYRRRIKSKFYSKNEGKISQYDEIVKTNVARLGWDWRLLSSQIFQESRFKPNENSWAGAGGLMQIMPATAKDLGISDITNPSENIRGGTKYLEQLKEKFTNVTDSIQKIKFTLAAYNCGLGHVRDAQRLAKAFDEDPYQWDDNVEDYMLKLSSREFFSRPEVKYGFVRGREPFLYVKEIFLRYKHYKKLIPFETPETNSKVASN